MKNKPVQVGVTGGIGSGKSIVCRVFQGLRVPVYDADSRARWITDNDPELRSEIIDHFGSQAYDNGGKLNRSFISAQVFGQGERINHLNQLVHPKVRMDYKSWLQLHLDHSYVIKEAALIFETGSFKFLAKIITVYAPTELRLKRVLTRDPFRTKDQIQEIMAKQWNEEDRQHSSDYVINNDGSTMILPQILEIHQQLVGLSDQSVDSLIWSA